MAHVIWNMIDSDEANVLKAYPDPITHGDPWTIGRGHTGSDVHEGLIWTPQQSDETFALDLMEAYARCRRIPWFDHVDYGQQDSPLMLAANMPAGATPVLVGVRQAVLVNMSFQMGNRLFTFHDALAAVRDEQYPHAAGCMLDSAWAKQTPKRAGRLARQMETGQWQYAETPT